MRKVLRPAAAFAVVACFGVWAVPAEAKSCFKKGAIGEAVDMKSAKFQVDEALLQAVDWGAWAAWMASGTTPGYTFGPRTYRCKSGGSWGVTCHGQATICKL